MKFQKGTIETTLLFLISPLLSLPAIFWQLAKKRNQWMAFLIAMFIGMLSFKYLPYMSNDKVVYMDNYTRFATYNFYEFLAYLTLYKVPDFFFPFSFFIFAKLSISVHYLFFLITTITVWSFLTFSRKTVSIVLNRNFQYSILTISTILLCFSIPTLFSGIRFIFAGSIFIWGIYYLFIDKHIIKSTAFFIIGILTHFSFAFFIPAIIIVYLFNNKANFKPLLLISLIFLLLPKDALSSILSYFNMPESYELKAESYLTGEREYTTSAILIRYINRIWLFLAYIYLLGTKKSNMNILYYITITFISLINITYSLPIVFERYSSISIILFAIYLVSLFINKETSTLVFYTFLTLLGISFIMDIIITRNNIIASYNISDMLTTLHIFGKKITYSNILQ